LKECNEYPWEIEDDEDFFERKDNNSLNNKKIF
jgi:hypothetical protein